MAAKNYTEILALVNAGNQMGLSNTIKRDYGIPLDFTSVQETYDAAVIYAAENTKAYVGQPLSVGGKLYIINDVAAETKYVIGEKEYDNYLVEVGSATEGDGATIDLENGVLTLHGFEGALSGYLPRKSEDGTLEWVPISAVVQGDGNKVTTLTSDDGSVTITKTTDTDESLVYDLSVEAYDDSAIQGRVDAIESAVGNAEGGLVKDIADNKSAIETNALAIETEKARAEAAESQALTDARAYTDEEIAGLSVVIEQKEGVEYIVVKDKAGNEVASADASKFVQDSFLDDVDYNAETGKVTFTWTMGDGSTKSDEIDISALVDTYTAGTGLKVENNEFSVDTDVIATVEALEEVREIADSAQTAQEVSDAIDAKITGANLGQYAVKTDVEAALSAKANASDVEAELAAKVESAEISHSTETVAEGATVADGKLSIVVDAFTKAETRQYVADTITSFTGGESAKDVLLALNNYKSDNDSRVGAIETKDGEQDTAIAAAQTQADKGVADAKTANDAIVTINSTLDTHGDDISAVKGRLTTLETAKGDHETRIASAEGKITSLETATANNASAIGALQGKASELVEEDTRLGGLIAVLQRDKANASDVYVKGEVDNFIAALTNDKADKSTTYTKTEVDALLTNLDQSGIKADIKANADAIAVLVGEDTDKSIRTIAAEEINALIDAANNEDTITNINSLINYVNENAGEIAQLTASVADNTGKLAGIESTVVAYVDSKVAAVKTPKGSDEIDVSLNGTISINQVNVNKLVQSDDEEFIIDGGRA